MTGGAESRHLGTIGARWLPVAVSVIIVLVLFVGLLEALLRTEEQAEKAMVELTTRHMQTGLRLAVGEALLKGRSTEVASWAGTNPVAHLAMPPRGYTGRCASTERGTIEAGEWCFDGPRGELLYRPRNQRHLRLIDATGGGAAVLRWRIVLWGEAPKDVSNIGVSVQLVTRYAWLE